MGYSSGDSGYVPPNLKLGVDYQGEKKLREIVERELSEFVEAVKNDGADLVSLHQDSFAAGYTTIEYLLLGMAIKYAGLYGKTVMFGGTNGERAGED